MRILDMKFSTSMAPGIAKPNDADLLVLSVDQRAACRLQSLRRARNLVGMVQRNYRSHEKLVKFRLNKSPAPNEVKNVSDLTAVRLDYTEGQVSGSIRFIKQRVKADPAAVEAALDAFLDALGIA